MDVALLALAGTALCAALMLALAALLGV